eukprot:m.205485 g.205485  ORF g.205485 m.205485 type:complete len:431 (-) comp32919_c0_seq1:31-1323(-)
MSGAIELVGIGVLVAVTRSYWAPSLRWGASVLIAISLLAAVFVVVNNDQPNSGFEQVVGENENEKRTMAHHQAILPTKDPALERLPPSAVTLNSKVSVDTTVVPPPVKVTVRPLNSKEIARQTPNKKIASPNSEKKQNDDPAGLSEIVPTPLPEEEKLRSSIGNFMVIQVLAYLPRGPVPDNLTMYYDPTVGQGSRWEPFWWKLKEDYAWVWSRIGDRVRRWTKTTAYLNITANEERIELFEWAKQATLVHFRCSDAPFVRGSTHLQPREYWKFVADELVKLNAKTVVFTMCTNWLTDNMASHRCPVFLEQSRQFLVDSLPAHITVEPGFKCWGPRTTWNLLLNCDILVSGLESSFSFIPGMTKGDRYISPKMQATRKDQQKRYPIGVHELVPWRMYTGMSIYHDLVADYATFDLSAFSFPDGYTDDGSK